jgi:iron complex transport system ATP-binding protein
MLVIDHLTVAYKERVALQDINLKVKPGQVIALIGPNGAGKSTLIRAVSGVLAKRSGHVWFDGLDLMTITATERARIVAVVPQAQPLGGTLTVEHTVLLGRTPHMSWLGNPGRADLDATRKAMAVTSIDHLAQRRNAELSGGEQQRVLLARALAQQTPVLLLDEPTNHLDLQHQYTFLNLVKNLAREANLMILMALHDLNQVSLFADQVLLLVDGKELAAGLPEQVLTTVNISTAYRIPVKILHHPDADAPLIIPQADT